MRMTKHQSLEELMGSAAVIPVDSPINLEPMTRKQKLERLAKLIREIPSGKKLMNFHRLEYLSPAQRAVLSTDVVYDGLTLAQHRIVSAFDLAASDPILKDAGLQSNKVGEAERFFGLSIDELHEFSC